MYVAAIVILLDWRVPVEVKDDPWYYNKPGKPLSPKTCEMTEDEGL